jgi:hypothetical protein
VSAAWLHDIGYAATCVRTGFHALDGAVAVLEQGFSDRVAGLVAQYKVQTVLHPTEQALTYTNDAIQTAA